MLLVYVGENILVFGKQYDMSAARKDRTERSFN